MLKQQQAAAAAAPTVQPPSRGPPRGAVPRNRCRFTRMAASDVLVGCAQKAARQGVSLRGMAWRPGMACHCVAWPGLGMVAWVAWREPGRLAAVGYRQACLVAWAVGAQAALLLHVALGGKQWQVSGALTDGVILEQWWPMAGCPAVSGHLAAVVAHQAALLSLAILQQWWPTRLPYCLWPCCSSGGPPGCPTVSGHVAAVVAHQASALLSLAILQ
jgi:hypothetical protein